MDLSTYTLTGLAPVEPSYHRASPVEAGAVAIPDGLRGLVSPHNPLFWFGGILAVTFGLVGVSGSVRVGKARATAGIDKT